MKRHSPRSQGQPGPSSVPERETPAIIPPRPPEKGLLRAFTSLRQRNYRLYWFGQMISLIGSYMQTIGQAWLVLELTHSAWQLALVARCNLWQYCSSQSSEESLPIAGPNGASCS